MRIGIFSLAPLTNNTGSPIRTRLMIEGMQDTDVEIVIISPGIPEEFQQHFECYAVQINSTTREQLIHILSQCQIDILYVSTEGLIDVLYNVCQIVGCLCVVDLHAFSLIEQIELYGWKAFERRAIHIRAALRRLWALRKVDAMTVANPTLFPFAKIVNRNSTLIAGMTDVARFAPRSSSPESRISANIQVYYLGNFLSWQGCDLLLEAARILIEEKNAPYDFNFVGGSLEDREKNTQDWRRFVDTGRMRFYGSVDYDQIPEKFQQADILVIPRPWMLSTYLAFPGKISDYMASGNAIVATNLKPHRYAIEDGKNGILCDATPPGIVAGLLRLQDHDVRNRLGQQARVTAENMFDKKNQARQALEFLKQVYAEKYDD